MKKTVAKALITRPDKKMLLLYRGDTHPRFAGHLDLPGGELDGEETYAEAVVREIDEETGITTDQGSVTQVYIKQHPEVDHIVFTADIDQADPTVTLSWEHKGHIWMSMAELLATEIPANCDPYFLDVIEYLQKLSVE